MSQFSGPGGLGAHSMPTGYIAAPVNFDLETIAERSRTQITGAKTGFPAAILGDGHLFAKQFEPVFIDTFEKRISHVHPADRRPFAITSFNGLRYNARYTQRDVNKRWVPVGICQTNVGYGGPDTIQADDGFACQVQGAATALNDSRRVINPFDQLYWTPPPITPELRQQDIINKPKQSGISMQKLTGKIGVYDPIAASELLYQSIRQLMTNPSPDVFDYSKIDPASANSTVVDEDMQMGLHATKALSTILLKFAMLLEAAGLVEIPRKILYSEADQKNPKGDPHYWARNPERYADIIRAIDGVHFSELCQQKYEINTNNVLNGVPMGPADQGIKSAERQSWMELLANSLGLMQSELALGQPKLKSSRALISHVIALFAVPHLHTVLANQNYSMLKYLGQQPGKRRIGELSNANHDVTSILQRIHNGGAEHLLTSFLAAMHINSSGVIAHAAEESKPRTFVHLIL